MGSVFAFDLPLARPQEDGPAFQREEREERTTPEESATGLRPLTTTTGGT